MTEKFKRSSIEESFEAYTERMDHFEEEKGKLFPFTLKGADETSIECFLQDLVEFTVLSLCGLQGDNIEDCVEGTLQEYFVHRLQTKESGSEGTGFYAFKEPEVAEALDSAY